MIFRQLFDRETCTYTYLLADEETRQAVLIDPVLEQVDRDIKLLRELELELMHTLETHVHADHVTGGGTLRERLGSSTVVALAGGTLCADIQVGHGDLIQVGSLRLEARATPGHTSGCVTYVVHEAGMAFTGDALMIRGCGRTDFQQGDAKSLYHSVHGQVLSLPPATRLYPGHDYKGRTVTTVAEERRFNPRLGGGRTDEEFAAIMDNLGLPLPKHIHVAVPANLHCGQWAPYARRDDGVPEVQVRWVATGLTDARVIDVRSEAEFLGELGHIPDAELLPLQDLLSQSVNWPRDLPLVLVCRLGGRSATAVKGLQNLGFSKVVSMAGGMQAWNEAGLPVAQG